MSSHGYICTINMIYVHFFMLQGIGYETALDLAGRNARVILACRRMEQGQQACENIQQQTGNTNVLVKHLDLSSLDSVRKFAQDFKETEDKLHILVNNAGIGERLIWAPV